MSPSHSAALHRHGRTLVVELARPKSGNAMDLDLLTALADRLEEAAQARPRALVLAAAGRAFSLGGDVTGFAELVEAGEDAAIAHLRRSIDDLGRSILLLRRFPAPTVAAVQGQAAGAGLSLALACDLRVMADRAALNVAYGRLGASPDGGMTWLLPRVIAPARAVRLLMRQPVLRAEQALAEGLVDEVVPRAATRDAALAAAGRLGALAPHAVVSARLLVDAAHGATLEQQLDRERETFAAGVRTPDLQRAVAAAARGEVFDFAPCPTP